jgi:hypothetical protein
MVFFENKENSGKISKGLLGKGTQMPSPSPDPFFCQEMQESESANYLAGCAVGGSIPLSRRYIACAP